MRRHNPFLSVPTLQSFARSVAASLGRGERVLAVIGPYDTEEFRIAVGRLGRMELPVDAVPVFEGTLLVRDNGERLAVARAVNPSEKILCGEGVEGWYGQVMWCPTNLMRTELRELAFRMIADEKGLSSVFRTMVIDYACELCCGDLSTLWDALEVCLRSEYRPPQAFVHPAIVASECARLQKVRTGGRAILAGACPGPSVPGFRRQLMRSLVVRGRSQEADEEGAFSARLNFMWMINWSQGLCSRMDGTWFPSWETVMDGTRPWVPDTGCGSDVSRAADVFEDVAKSRFAVAMQVAFTPVWELYKSQAIARFVDSAERASDELGWFDRTDWSSGEKRRVLVHRHSDVGSMCQAAAWDINAWGKVNGRIAFSAVQGLRNRVVHGNVDEIGGPRNVDLKTLGELLDELATVERAAYASCNRRCFC